MIKWLLPALFPGMLFSQSLDHLKELNSSRTLAIPSSRIVVPDSKMELVILYVRKNLFGIRAGYASAFAHTVTAVPGAAVSTKPGLELGISYKRVLRKRMGIVSGVSFLTSNFEVSAPGTAFMQRNDRLCVPLLFTFFPYRGDISWLRRFQLMAGLQGNVYAFKTPETQLDVTTGIRNSVLRKKSLEILAVGELAFGFRIRSRAQTVSISYAYGLNQTFRGTVDAPALQQTYLTYKNSGTYLSLKYTYWIKS